MSESKHTSGPWEYSRQAVKSLGFYIQTSEAFIGEVGGGRQPDWEIEANAALIAQAPDMYEVLCGIAKKLEYLSAAKALTPTEDEILYAAKSAIEATKA